MHIAIGIRVIDYTDAGHSACTTSIQIETVLKSSSSIWTRGQLYSFARGIFSCGTRDIRFTQAAVTTCQYQPPSMDKENQQGASEPGRGQGQQQQSNFTQ